MLDVAGTLTFGAGMYLVMASEGMLIGGIIVGLIGVVLLLCLIPVCKGIR